MMEDRSRSRSDSDIFPARPVERWLAPVARFLHVQSSSGLVLIAATVVALVLANSPWKAIYFHVLELPCVVGVGEWILKKDLLHVVNDGLMTVFFFVVGLEIKRELLAGELRGWRKASLPVFAALGGMVAPALIFLAIAAQRGFDADLRRGWAIPMATDIAFVVGVLALLGRRAPAGLRILLLSLAIVDDLGAVLVIALVFTDQLAWAALGVAGAGVGLTWFFNRAGVRSVTVYVLLGAVVWLAVLKSNVHPTIAGVLLGLMTPLRPWIPLSSLADVIEKVARQVRDESDNPSPGTLRQAEFAAREAVSPLHRLETLLHPWVAFAIMPVFALANAGVEIRPEAIAEPVALAVAAGLALGKPLGIFLFSAAAVGLGLAQRPAGVSWGTLFGGACLAGIGFTMSLFLTALALPESAVAAGKIGTLTGSVVSAIVGTTLLLMSRPIAAPLERM